MKSSGIIASAMVCVFLLAGSPNAQAQEKKIGFLDLSKIFDSYGRTREYDSVLEAEHQVYTKERDGRIEKLKEAQGKLALLKEEERKKVQKNIEKMTQDLRNFDQVQRTDLTKQRDEKLREILLEIEKVVSDFGKKAKYDLILNDRVLIYGRKALDVTDEILKILNKSYNKK